MELQVSRDGVVIGVLELENLATSIAGGTVLPTDFGWHEGMTDWKPVSELAPATEPKKKAKPPKLPVVKKDWRQEPATEKQIEFLKSFGVAPAPGLKKGEASELIDQCVNDPDARRVQEEKRFASWEAAAEQQRQERASSGGYSFRKDVEVAKAAVAEEMKRISASKAETSAKNKGLALLQKKLPAATGDAKEELEEQIENLECDLSDLECDPIDLQGYKEELKEAETVRLKFWKATFKEDWIMSADASDHEILVDVSSTIDRFFEAYGRYFKSPTNKQIKDILESLDKASPDWDKVQPDAFFARLHENFPNQMRTGDSVRSSAAAEPRRTPAKAKGCLVILLSGVLLFLALVCVLAFMAGVA